MFIQPSAFIAQLWSVARDSSKAKPGSRSETNQHDLSGSPEGSGQWRWSCRSGQQSVVHYTQGQLTDRARFHDAESAMRQ